MIHSRISSKAQTTIPRPVCAALGLKKGDRLAYEIDGDRVVLSRLTAEDPLVGNFATFTEWSDEADTRVYAGF